MLTMEMVFDNKLMVLTLGVMCQPRGELNNQPELKDEFKPYSKKVDVDIELERLEW